MTHNSFSFNKIKCLLIGLIVFFFLITLLSACEESNTTNQKDNLKSAFDLVVQHIEENGVRTDNGYKISISEGGSKISFYWKSFINFKGKRRTHR